MGLKQAGLAAVALALAVISPEVARAQTATDYTSYTKYDALRRPIMKFGPVVNGKRRVEQIVYDPDGQVIETDVGTVTGGALDANGVFTGYTNLDLPQKVTNRYDAAGNKTQVYANGGTTAATLTQTSYDGADRAVCVAVRMDSVAFAGLYAGTDRPDACTPGATPGTQGPDRVTKTTYDAAGQVKRIDQAVGTGDTRIYARYEYTDNGLQREIVDANGNRTTLTYDGFDRLGSQVFPSTTRADPGQIGASNAADYEQYGYDLNGNRVSLRKRDGNVVRYCYDALNRQTIKRPSSNVTDCSAAGSADDVFTVYDLAGKVKSTRFQSATGAGVIYGYDSAGRLTSEETYGRKIAFELDAAGNRTKLTWPETAYYATSGYDAAGHQSWTVGGTARIDFTYDGLGRRVLDSRSSGAWTTSYCYDVASRLTAWGLHLANGELTASPTCETLNTKAAGFVTQGGVNKDQVETFAYNPAGQVVGNGRANGVYLWTGNAASLSATADGLNRDVAISTVGGGGCAASGKGYDCNGNLTNDGWRSFAYDRENRLVSMSGLAGATLEYDPLGRLAKTTINGTTTRFLYDGDQLVAEYDVKVVNGASVETLLRRYLHGSGTDDPLVWYEGADLSAPRYLHADRQGSIIGWSDASGVSQATYTYGPYGEPGDNWAAGSRFRYTGQAALPELKLYHYKARVYDPMRGWFLQTDPIGYQDDLDLYAYTGNDPVNKGDPTGTQVMSQAFYPEPASLPTPEQSKELAQYIADHPGETIEVTGDAIQVVSTLTAQPEGVALGRGVSTAGRVVKHFSGETTTAVPVTTRPPVGTGRLPKPPTGPGRVPRSERDPKRFWTPSERAAKREEQGGQCAHGCGTKIDETNSRGHHKDRHADGGRTDDPNHAEVCIPCHVEIHSGN